MLTGSAFISYLVVTMMLETRGKSLYIILRKATVCWQEYSV